MNSYKREDNKIMKKYSVVGKSLTRVDGIAKVTGRAKFTYDMELPNMLWGRILRSPYPHASTTAKCYLVL